MSLFGALYSGVSGLQSQSSAMGAIADNVTNVNTIGYKQTDVAFKTLVTAQTSSTQYSPGGVQSAPRQAVNLQGLLQATTSSTDLAISGDGFFVTSADATTNDDSLFTYTRAGSFSVDQAGYLENTGGAYIQGWPLTTYNGAAGASTITISGNTYMRAYTDGSGNQVLINNNVIDSENMQPLNLQTIGGTASPTTTLSIGANLPSGAALNAQSTVNGVIYDSLGNAHNIGVTYTKTAANTWSSTIEPPDDAATVVQKTQAGDVYQAAGRLDFSSQANGAITGTIDMSVGGQAFTIYLDPNNADSTSPFGPGSSPLTVNTTGRTVSQIVQQLATEINGVMSDDSVFGTPPNPPGTWCRQVAGTDALTFDQADDVNSLTFDASAKDSTGTQLISQSATGGYTIPALDPTYGGYLLTPGSPNVVTVNTAALTFNGAGSPQEIFGSDSAQQPNPKSSIEIVWANGAAPMQAGDNASPAIQLSQGDYNEPDGITQLAGSYQLNFLQQDGAKFGNFSGVSINTDGVVTALFDNGVTRPIYQIPLATFTNPDGLTSESGNVWIATDLSGNPTLREPGSSGAGQVDSSSLEQSTVDLGTQFTDMITTQRAYSAAAKVITTADQMLDDLMQVSR